MIPHYRLVSNLCANAVRYVPKHLRSSPIKAEMRRQ